MNPILRTAWAAVTLAATAHASAQVTVYETEGFHGRPFTTRSQVLDFSRFSIQRRLAVGCRLEARRRVRPGWNSPVLVQRRKRV